jgi:hypothetical protein
MGKCRDLKIGTNIERFYRFFIVKNVNRLLFVFFFLFSPFFVPLLQKKCTGTIGNWASSGRSRSPTKQRAPAQPSNRENGARIFGMKEFRYARIFSYFIFFLV